jgi:serine/threonine-protein kinase
MVSVQLDGHGRLLGFEAMPYKDGSNLAQPIPPEAIFQAAGLDIATFGETSPTLLPNSAADQVRAWKGPHPKLPHTQLVVEIASWRGRITQARVEYPWQTNAATTNSGPTWFERARQIFVGVVIGAGILFAVLMARRNWKLGRIDRRGALLVGIAQFLLAIIVWIGHVHPVEDDGIFDLLQSGAADALMSAAVIWILYLALEPAIRARWPHALVTWNRILAGRWLDPQVGSHLLIGAAVGCGLSLGIELATMWLYPNLLFASGNLVAPLGARHWIGENAGFVVNALKSGLLVFLGICALRALLRKDVFAAIVAAVLFTLLEGEVFSDSDWKAGFVVYVILFAVLIFALLRFGLLATIAAVYFLDGYNAITLGADWRYWFAPAGLATLLLLLGIAIFAFWRSLGSRELLGDGVEAS